MSSPFRRKKIELIMLFGGPADGKTVEAELLYIEGEVAIPHNFCWHNPAEYAVYEYRRTGRYELGLAVFEFFRRHDA